MFRANDHRLQRPGVQLGARHLQLLGRRRLLPLFPCLVKLERARGGGTRRRLKAAVWALTTLLTAMFASRVAPLMPPAVGALVYLTAAGTAGAGFWALFLHRH